MRRTFPMAAVGLSLSTVASAASDNATHLAQARLFMKRGWHADAADELRIVLATAEGQQSYEAHWLAAQVGWEIMDVGWAMDMAEGAARLAPDPGRAQQARALADSYATTFGFVTVDGPYPGMATRMQLEPTGLIFDAEQKRYVNRLSLQLRERTALPARVALPIGTYRLNGQKFAISPGSDLTLPLPMSAIGSRGLSALQVTRAELSAGIGLWTGEAARGLMPAPTVQLSITQPAGQVLVGVLLEASGQAFSGPDQQLQPSSSALSGGLRVGGEVFSSLPLAIRPSLQLRYARLPGLALDCEGGPTSWDCVAGSGAPEADLRVHATGFAWVPGIELAVDYREAGRTTALGTGVKVAVDHAFGGFPSPAEASLHDDPSRTFSYQADDVTWRATGVRLLANLSFAF